MLKLFRHILVVRHSLRASDINCSCQQAENQTHRKRHNDNDSGVQPRKPIQIVARLLQRGQMQLRGFDHAGFGHVPAHSKFMDTILHAGFRQGCGSSQLVECTAELYRDSRAVS